MAGRAGQCQAIPWPPLWICVATASLLALATPCAASARTHGPRSATAGTPPLPLPVPPAQRSALVDLFAATGGHAGSWHNSSGWTTGDPCAEGWFGVRCSGGGAVVGLALSGNGMAGSIPASIGSLRGLSELDVSWNDLSGGLPVAAMCNLTGLVRLSAGHNERLGGGIPDCGAAWGSLQEVMIPQSGLVGSLPSFVGMAALRVFSVPVNGLTGSIPRTLYRAASLATLEVYSNLLSGPAPSVHAVEGGLPKGLAILQLFNNSLSWWNTAIPSDAATLCTNLRRVNLARNCIRASLDVAFLDALGQTALVSLTLSQNVDLVVSVSELLIKLNNVGSINLADTAAYGRLSDVPVISPTLGALSLRSCRGVHGSLPVSNKFVDIAAIDVSNTSMAGKSLPSYLVPSTVLTPVPAGVAACRKVRAADAQSTVVYTVDDAYDNYARCQCLASYAGTYDGIPSSCMKCPLGKYSIAGDTKCTRCAAGKFQQTNSPRDGEYSCQACADGHFALGGVGCFPCPDRARCLGGTIAIDDGTWWAQSLVLSADMVLYPCISPSACSVVNATLLAAVSNSAAMATNPDTNISAPCGRGYKGPLCAVCEDSYVAVSSGQCVQCPSGWISALAGVSAVVVSVVFLLFSMYKVEQPGDMYISLSGVFLPNRVKSIEERKSKSALPVLVSYLQIVSVFGEFHVAGPAVLRRLLEVTGSAGGDSLVSAYRAPWLCSAPHVTFKGQLIATAILPIVLMCMVCAYVAARKLWCGSQRLQPFRESVTSGVAAVMFLVYTRVTKTAMCAFALYKVGQGLPAIDDRTFLSADFRISTDDRDYPAIQVVGALMLGCYTIGAPAMAAVSLGRFRKRMKGLHADQAHRTEGTAIEGSGVPDRVNHPLAFLVQSYKGRSWWWGLAKSARSIGFAAIAVFIADPALQAAVAVLLLVCLLTVQLLASPHNRPSLNRAESLGLAALLCTQLGSVLYDYSPSFKVEDDGTTGTSGVVLTVILMLLNAGTVLYMLALYLAERPWQAAIRQLQRLAASKG